MHFFVNVKINYQTLTQQMKSEASGLDGMSSGAVCGRSCTMVREENA